MRHDFQALQQCLLDDHQPATPSEALLVQKMVLGYWRLELLRLCQERPLASSRLSQTLERSVTRSQRNYFKLLESLKKLQNRRMVGFVLQKRVQRPKPSFERGIADRLKSGAFTTQQFSAY